jgi:ornithine carbamoyltransferase
MADLQTIWENLGGLDGVKVVYLGDGNNMANSWIHAAARFPIELVICNPRGFDPDPGVVANARRINPELRYSQVGDPAQAVAGADVLYTDVWASMGQEDEAQARKPVFMAYQVNSALLDKTGKKSSIVMHCLPAHRGDEITDEVIDGSQSVVFDQAENRLHTQRAILSVLM